MFKEIVSALTQKTLASVKSAPGKFSESLIKNIGARSPILGNVAQTVHDVRKKSSALNATRIGAAKTFSAQNIEKDFGQEVKKDNPTLDVKNLEKEMSDILMKLHKLSDKSPEKLKEDPLYKKYGKFFKAHDAQVKTIQARKAEESKANKDSSGKPEATKDSSPAILAKLGVIEDNTADTAKQIAELAKVPKEQKSKVEPKTQENIIAKVFSKPIKTDPIKDTNAPVVHELKKISKFLEAQALDDKTDEARALEDKNEASVKKQAGPLKEISENINKKNGPEATKSPSLFDRLKDKFLDRTTTTQNKPGSFRDGIRNTAANKAKIPGTPGASSKLGSAVKSVGSLGARALTGLASFAANPVVLGAAAVGAAGAAGYAAGNLLNENTNIQSNIASGIDTAKGWFGNSDEDNQKASEKKAAQDLYEKRVVEGKLTSKSAAFFEQQGIKVDKSKIVDMPTPVKSAVTKAVASTVATQESLAGKPPVSIQPIVLNSKTSTSSGSSGMQMLTGVNVRNSDTTFERVQMQDFWPRTE